jgi:beta-lactamase regulating signal transducer with metallopeptidase domain
MNDPSTIVAVIDPLARSLVGAAISVTIVGTVLTAGAAVVIGRRGNTGAASRFAVLAVLLALVMAPLLLACVHAAVTTEVDPAARFDEAPAIAPAAPFAPGSPETTAPATSMGATLDHVEPRPTAASSSPLLTVTMASPWPTLLLAGWAIVAGLLVGRLVLATLLLHRVRRDAATVHGRPRRMLDELTTKCPRRVEVALLSSADLTSPLVTGFIRPAIILPSGLAESLHDRDLASVLRHELGHVVRRDTWTNLAERLAITVAFFHPAVHWLVRRMDFEREVACDDFVVSGAAGARSYAACLTRLAELAIGRRVLLETTAPGMASRLGRRVELLLTRGRNTSPHASRPDVAVMAFVLAFLTTLTAWLTPTITLAAPPVATELDAFHLRWACQGDIAGVFMAGAIVVDKDSIGMEPANGFAVVVHRDRNGRFRTVHLGGDAGEPTIMLRENHGELRSIEAGDRWLGDLVPVLAHRLRNTGGRIDGADPVSDTIAEEISGSTLIGMPASSTDTAGTTIVGWHDGERRLGAFVSAGFRVLFSHDPASGEIRVLEEHTDEEAQHYSIDGRDVALDDDGRRWVAGILSQLPERLEAAGH